MTVYIRAAMAASKAPGMAKSLAVVDAELARSRRAHPEKEE